VMQYRLPFRRSSVRVPSAALTEPPQVAWLFVAQTVRTGGDPAGATIRRYQNGGSRRWASPVAPWRGAGRWSRPSTVSLCCPRATAVPPAPLLQPFRVQSCPWRSLAVVSLLLSRGPARCVCGERDRPNSSLYEGAARRPVRSVEDATSASTNRGACWGDLEGALLLYGVPPFSSRRIGRGCCWR
jgi:hypothetical protein